MKFSHVLDILGRFGHLQESEASEVMELILAGQVTQAQIGALLLALRMKGETIEEITGFARVLKKNASLVESKHAARLVDTCGTGGDRSGTINISTAVAFVVAACGQPVAKHCNRASSSKCGSADVLEEMGIALLEDVKALGETLDRTGLSFLFAPHLHRSMKQVGQPRRELGVRTIFNIVGPLVNPACAKKQLLGVFAPDLTETMARVLSLLGSEKAMVVSGFGGIDELTTTGINKITVLEDGAINSREIDPRELGFKGASVFDLMGGSPKENASILLEILKGNGSSACHETVVLNCAAALLVGEAVDSLSAGITLADRSIRSGDAFNKYLELKAFTDEAKIKQENEALAA